MLAAMQNRGKTLLFVLFFILASSGLVRGDDVATVVVVVFVDGRKSRTNMLTYTFTK